MNTSSTAKRILVYGDSYTFGKIPQGLRFASDTRFTGVFQKALGEEYEVIEEGLRGRLLDGENAFFPYRNGAEQFGPILGSHLPLDLLIIFLGTNDANSGSTKSAAEIIQGYDKYLEKIRWWCDQLGFSQPQILLVAPPNILEEDSYKAFKSIFEGSASKIKELPLLIEQYAQANNLYFFDASTVVVASPLDGIHLDEAANKVLGEALAARVRQII